MITTPDAHGTGFAATLPDALRYDGHTDDPEECAGILRALMPDHVKVLDVGCGTGSVSLIANAGKENTVFGVEPDPQRSEVARARGLNIACDYLRPSYLVENGPFDVAMFADVLEHLANPADTLNLVKSGLKEGGWLLVSVPNAVHWIMRAQLLFGRFEYADCGIRDATHLRWFTESSIVRLLDFTGFEAVEIKHSAGATLPEYSLWRPWRWMGEARRSNLVRKLAKYFPSVFGGQLIIKARKR